MLDCIFCKIVEGKIPCHKVWEDENYLAFLDINPQVQGMTLVVPKKHTTSYFVDNTKETMTDLIEAAQKVAVILDTKLDNVKRTKLVFEGIDVDHLHAKLYPMYKEKPESLELEKIVKILAE